MEHRAGQRVAIREQILLRVGKEGPIPAVLVDMSVSGAFISAESIDTDASEVHIWWSTTLGIRSSRAAIRARVVRRSPTGFGIEWSDFAPRAVCVRLNRRWLQETLQSLHPPSTMLDPQHP